MEQDNKWFSFSNLQKNFCFVRKSGISRYIIITVIIQVVASHTGFSQAGSRGVFDYSNAQQFLQDMNGKPIYLKVNYNIEGTPFYPEQYYKADLFIKNGKTYENIYVKFNLQENLVLFKSPDGVEMSATSAVQKIIFTDTINGGIMINKVFENGFPAIDKQNENSYYEVLDSGKVKLLKYHAVRYTDKNYYGDASITRVFEQTEICYFYEPGKRIKKIEKGMKELLSLFTDKRTELNKYIDEQKLKCRNENDWEKVIAYYNSLFTNT